MQTNKTRPCGRVSWQLLIFPWGYPQSIVRAEELNYRVRDGNGCTLFAKVTNTPAHTGGFVDACILLHSGEVVNSFFDEIEKCTSPSGQTLDTTPAIPVSLVRCYTFFNDHLPSQPLRFAMKAGEKHFHALKRRTKPAQQSW